MRGRGHFGGLLKPIPDEAFSAWLGRGVRSKNPIPFECGARCLEGLGIKDADGVLSSAAVEDLSRALGLSGESLRRSFPLPGCWLKAPSEGRLQFCEYCLLNDFCCDHQPTLRFTWFYWWFTVCPVHRTLLGEKESTSAPAALLSFIQFNQSLGQFALWTPNRLSWNYVFDRLVYMALDFQHWYLKSVQRGSCIIGDVELPVGDVELAMGDILAIIGKKRSYPFDQRSYVAELLNIKSWCSLRSDLHPDSGCEPFLCLDVGEHPVNIRMAMFALLGLFLKLPRCVHMWGLGTGLSPRFIEGLWSSMHRDAVRVPSYLAWFKQRSESWSAPVRAHFRYLLDS